MPVAAICVAMIADGCGPGCRGCGAGLESAHCVADFEIGVAVALTREDPLVSGGENRVVTNALQRPQYMVVCAGPIRSIAKAGVDVVPGHLHHP